MTVPAHDRAPYDSVPYDTDIAQAAALMADPTRAAMLRALLSDRPLAAGELARLAGGITERARGIAAGDPSLPAGADRLQF